MALYFKMANAEPMSLLLVDCYFSKGGGGGGEEREKENKNVFLQCFPLGC